MNLLFVHQNFPGQYKHLAPALAARPGHSVVALGLQPPPVIPGIQTLRYAVARGNTPGIHPWLLDAETKVIRGEAAAIAADQLRVQGFRPDLICVHPGWGEALFLHEVLFPQEKQYDILTAVFLQCLNQKTLLLDQKKNSRVSWLPH